MIQRGIFISTRTGHESKPVLQFQLEPKASSVPARVESGSWPYLWVNVEEYMYADTNSEGRDQNSIADLSDNHSSKGSDRERLHVKGRGKSK